MIKNILGASIFIILASCGMAQRIDATSYHDVNTPKSLNINAEKFDKKLVYVRGVLSVDAESRTFWTDELSRNNENLLNCTSLFFKPKMEMKLISMKGATVELRGTFYKNVNEFIDPRAIILGMCGNSGIVVQSVLVLKSQKLGVKS